MHHGQGGADDVLAQVVEFRIRQGLAGKTQLNDGHVGRPIAQYQRRRDVGRHVLEHDQRAARQLRDRAGHIGAFVQVHFLDADALVAHGLDSRDVIHQRGELALVQGQNAVLHVPRAHAVVGPHHRDDGDVDFREDIDGHAQRGADPHQGNQDEHRDDGIGALQRDFDNGHSETSAAYCNLDGGGGEVRSRKS